MSFRRRILPLLLAACLLIAMLPAAALAADTGKAIQLVSGGSAANIAGRQADNVFFGNYFQSNSATKDPVKWRVLSNASGQLFLLADQNLDVFQYHTEQEAVTWETSTMRSWLNGYDASANTGGSTGIDYTDDNFLDAAFSDREQAAIVVTNVVNDDNDDTGTDGGIDTNDRIFLLSIADLYTYSQVPYRPYWPSTNTAYVAAGGKLGNGMNAAGDADWWWLRSPGSDQSQAAFVEWEDASSNTDGQRVNYDYMAVRPAFNLDLSSVLFTSAADGGKPSGLAQVDDYSGSDWKLTFLDSARTFAAFDAIQGGNTVIFSYSGAQTGANEYLSAVVMDGDVVTCYGRILQPSSDSGTASLTLPDGVTLGGATKLYVFNEQYNGDRQTDYASELIELTPDSMQSPAIATFVLPGGREGESYSQTLSATSVAPVSWIIESGSLPAGLALSGDTISGTPLAAGTFTFVVRASNAAGSDSRELTIVIEAVPVEPTPEPEPELPVPTVDQEIPADLGDSVTLRMRVMEGFTYQWYVDDGTGFEEIPGATAAAYTIPEVTHANDDYLYYCVATSDDLMLVSPLFTLDVPVAVSTPPQTGDATPLALYALLALLALASLAALTTARRRHI